MNSVFERYDVSFARLNFQGALLGELLKYTVTTIILIIHFEVKTEGKY